MSINHVFYKNWIMAEIEDMVSRSRKQLMTELVAAGSDPVLAHRRRRMLRDLSVWHAQIIDKLHSFHTDNVQDYLNTRNFLMDHNFVINRNA